MLRRLQNDPMGCNPSGVLTTSHPLPTKHIAACRYIQHSNSPHVPQHPGDEPGPKQTAR